MIDGHVDQARLSSFPNNSISTWHVNVSKPPRTTRQEASLVAQALLELTSSIDIAIKSPDEYC